jgi:hypothetical protein
LFSFFFQYVYFTISAIANCEICTLHIFYFHVQKQQIDLILAGNKKSSELFREKFFWIKFEDIEENYYKKSHYFSFSTTWTVCEITMRKLYWQSSRIYSSSLHFVCQIKMCYQSFKIENVCLLLCNKKKVNIIFTYLDNS